MRLETERLILRPFEAGDAEDLFSYAQDPRVGPPAGWKPHESLEESREIIRTVFSEPGVFAVVHRQDGRVIGSAGTGRRPEGRTTRSATPWTRPTGDGDSSPRRWRSCCATGLRTWASTPSGATTMTAIRSPSGSSGSAAFPSASSGCSV